MANNFIPATTGLSRVFVQEGRAGPNNVLIFQATLMADALSGSFGDATEIEAPHPTKPGAYQRIGYFQSGEERPTITLTGRFPLDMRSTLLRLAKLKCPFDVQLHFGDCEDLSNPATWKKVVLLEEAIITAYNSDPLGSLADADTAAVNESVDLSVGEAYDITPALWLRRADDIVTNEIVGVTIADEINCGGDCGEPSDGCEKVYMVSTAAGGSPGTPCDVIFSLDAGLTWRAVDVDTIPTATAPTGIAVLRGFVVVISQAAASGIHYAPVSQHDAFGTDPAYTANNTGFVTGAGPTCIHVEGTVAMLGGMNGRIYKMTDPVAGVTVLENGALAPVSRINDIDAYSERFWVAVGNGGVILWTEDGLNWAICTTPPVGVGVNLNTVVVRSKVEWWVGTSDGRIFYTVNKGVNWTQKRFTGDGAGSVRAIHFATPSIGYFSHDTAAPRGRIFMTIDGGNTWNLMPMGSAIMPLADRFTAVAVCTKDPGLVVAAGLHDNGTDGIAVTGKM